MKLLTVALLSALGMAGCGSDDDDPITTVRLAAPSFSAAWPALIPRAQPVSSTVRPCGKPCYGTYVPEYVPLLVEPLRFEVE